ncbi:MAG: hypothetical protein ACE5QV_05950, partial [Fidelibacterota bacterium]
MDSLIAAFDERTPAADPSGTGILSSTKGIYEELTSVFGNPPDVDNDTRIYVLLQDVRDYWNDRSGSTSQGDLVVDGYLLSRNEASTARSMKREVIYIDVRRQSINEAKLTLAHQLMLLIQYANDYDEDIWVNEGLAMMAEYLVGYKDYQALGWKGFTSISYAFQNP